MIQYNKAVGTKSHFSINIQLNKRNLQKYIKYIFNSFLIQGPVFSLMMATYA